MTEASTVTSKSMINLPAVIRRKYGIKQGDKVAFLETDAGLILVRVPPLREMFGGGTAYHDVLVKSIRELEKEHRREASE
ncbi:MAG: AbrB/MazE/SpoVT family DNA-binding domain-containing protein [Thaumarchaeota archaeon]|nr:AbrB/MazE/SpoVT family DNA-binding domain-containing protein [Nitrososphaerota archaeon]